MSGIPASKNLTVQEQRLACLPGGYLLLGDAVEEDSLDIVAGCKGDIRPLVDLGRGKFGRPRTIQFKMCVPCRGAVGDHGHGQGCRMGRIFGDLHVQHGGEPAQTLGANTQAIYGVVDFHAQLFELICRTPLDQFLHVDWLHERFLGEQHRLVDGPTDADADNAGRAPAGSHGAHSLFHPFDDGIAGVEHGDFALVFRAAAFRSDMDFQGVAGDDLGVDDSRGIVLGIFSVGSRVRDDRLP